MRVELLISTMNCNDYIELLTNMNVQTDAIIVNQCSKHGYKNILFGDYNIKIYEFKEKGIGLSRNSSLMRSQADYCLFSDDDMRYVDNYCEIVNNAFLYNPNADIIIFNLMNCGNRYIIKKKFNVTYKNFMRFGTARIAIKRESVIKKGISFNLCFGGGAKYGSGEDTLFIKDCISNGLKVIAVPITVAELSNKRESTWFNGYTEKFFKDKGALFGCMSRKYALFIAALILLKNHSNAKDIGLINAFKCMRSGIKEFKKYS